MMQNMTQKDRIRLLFCGLLR